MRTLAAGLEVMTRSSIAVANITESAARSFFSCEVERSSRRICPKSSRTSAGSMSVTFQVLQTGRAWSAIGRRYSARVVSEKPRAVPACVVLDPSLEVGAELNSGFGPLLAGDPVGFCLSGLVQGPEALFALFAAVFPGDDVSGAAPVDAAISGLLELRCHVVCLLVGLPTGPSAESLSASSDNSRKDGGPPRTATPGPGRSRRAPRFLSRGRIFLGAGWRGALAIPRRHGRRPPPDWSQASRSERRAISADPSWWIGMRWAEASA